MRALLVVPIVALSACATPSDRITDALVAYGLAPPQAQCMGQRLEDRLSINQLRELARYARAYRENDPDPHALGTTDLIRVASQVQDARVPIEVGKAAANCGLFPHSATRVIKAFLTS